MAFARLYGKTMGEPDRKLDWVMDIIILSMLLCINGEFFSTFQYLSKYGGLHQDLDYIVYLQYWIDFDCIKVVLEA